MKKESVLLAANFSSDTGYAWRNIYKIFNVIARNLHKKDLAICLSFARIVQPIAILDSDIPFHAFVFDPININLRGLLNLRKEVKRQNICYVYFTDMGGWHWLYALLRLWGVKRIVSHNRVSVPSPLPPPTEIGIKKLIKTIMSNSKFFSANAIYAVSGFVKDRLIRKACYPADRVITILNGIDLDKFNFPEKSEFHNDKIKIFAGCRASKYKGIHILIRATKLLIDLHSLNNFLVEYAGDGPDINDFKEEVDKLQLKNKFIFLGQLKNPNEKIINADIIVVPSIWGDACPSAVIEAMAAGKVLVTTNVGGIPEIVGDSRNASIVPHSNSERLAKELAELIMNKDKRIPMGKMARLRVEKNFREEIYHQKVIDQLLKDFGQKE